MSKATKAQIELTKATTRLNHTMAMVAENAEYPKSRKAWTKANAKARRAYAKAAAKVARYA